MGAIVYSSWFIFVATEVKNGFTVSQFFFLNFLFVIILFILLFRLYF